MIVQSRYPDSPREWYAVIGIDYECFTRITEMCSVHFESQNGQTYEQHLSLNPNEKQVRFQTLEQLIFATLMVLKSGITFDLFGYLMQIDQSYALRQFKKGLQILHDTLDTEGYTPIRSFDDPEHFRNQFLKGETLILDGTEQFIQRPSNYEEQKLYFSGKKKRHTVKTLIISTLDRYIHFASALYIGKSHDFSILKEEFPPGESWFDPFIVRVDLGYQGFAKAYPKVRLFIPAKKPRGGELTAEQKELNKQSARQRIKVEHAIGGIKRYDILVNTWRMHDYEVFNQAVGTCAALWNYLITK